MIAQPENDLGVHVTKLPVKAKSMLIAADWLKSVLADLLLVPIVRVGELHLQGVCQHVQVTAVTPLQLEGVVRRLDQFQGRGCWWQGSGGHLVDGTETPWPHAVHGLDAHPAQRTRENVV